MKYIFLALIIGVIAITGCLHEGGTTTPITTPAAPQSPGITEAELIISHTDYSPSKITAKLGDTVKISARTVPGQQDHNHGVTIDEYGINQAVTTTDKSNPVMIELKANKKGMFKIYCKTCWDGPFGTGHPNIQATLEVI